MKMRDLLMKNSIIRGLTVGDFIFLDSFHE